MPPKYPRKDTKTLEPDYNMNQLSLNIPTAYEPELNHPARYINRLVESLALRRPNIMGRPREYDPRMQDITLQKVLDLLLIVQP